MAQPAVAASDGDTFWVGQGSNTLVRQTLSALWPWISARLVTFKHPIVEISTNTTVDGAVHNGRLLICSQPVTLTPIAGNMGSGFVCDIINLSAGVVTLGGGSILSSSGQTALQPGQAATLWCATYSGGTVLYAFMGNGGVQGTSSSPATGIPGAVSGVTASNATASSIQLTWIAPTTGGAVTGYAVQFRLSGTNAWSGTVSGISSLSQTITGLAAGSAYDFIVVGSNANGSGPSSAVVTASTTMAAGAVTSIVWNVAPSGSYVHGSGVIGVNVHVTPSAAAVQFGFSTSATAPPSSWTAGVNVNSDLWGAYVPTPGTAGTWYAWAAGTDGSAPTHYATAFSVS